MNLEKAAWEFIKQNKNTFELTQLTIKMLENEVEKFPKAKGFIFDGFPRTTIQA